MPDFAVPPSDEPFDFRAQAAVYARYRRDYAPALYDAITVRTGPAGGGTAIDLGCGTGFVMAALAARGWRAVGVDFSGPMLEAARAAHPALPVVRARGEAMGLRTGAAVLVTCGTAFHWIPPGPGLAEIARVLAPGGTVAFFWRYAVAGQPHMEAVRDALAAVGVPLPDAYAQYRVHAEDPFAGSPFIDVEARRVPAVLDFTAESFHGWVATIEFLRRMTGARHPEFLAGLRARLSRDFPTIREANEEYLFLARRP